MLIMERLKSPPPLMIVSDLDHTMVDHQDHDNLSLLRFNSLWEDAYRRDSLLDTKNMLIMERLKSPPPLMIVSDLDHTMVDHQDHDNLSLLRFNSLWEDAYRRDSLLVFSTARSPILYKELRKEKPLLTPDIIVTSIGTEIAFGNSMVPDHSWVETLNTDKWNREIVLEETSKFPELTLQPKTEQRLHKRLRRGEIKKYETYIASFKEACHQDAVFFHPAGGEKSLRDTIDELKKYNGNRSGKKFWVWVDQVRVIDKIPGKCIVKFDKWEQCEDERKCCTTTVEFSSKGGGCLVWEQVKQIWSEKSELNDENSCWII
ncbi:hypothetical protein F2Q68_00026519 [Brassica cretica]|uniref:Sucrose phosphatase-like domain-containing protein n=1 Tax=Brassica cretica TaxID=69181 RepID=A0A8S9IH83_BRACR|nr:hypothetical protein F2Q68_00026519 [Brassica cretica]